MKEKRESPPTTEGAHSRAVATAKDQGYKLARDLINNLFVLLKTAYIHQQNNAALIPPLEKIQQTVAALFEETGEDVVRLRLVSNTFFLNESLIRMDQSTFQNSEFLKVICEELDISEWEFQKSCGESEFREMMAAIVDIVRGGAGTEGLLRRELGLVRLKPRDIEATESQSPLGRRQFVLHTYATALAFAAKMVALWPQGNRPGLSAIKRIAQRLLDAVSEDCTALFGVMQTVAYRKLLASHLVNVSVLSMALGRKAGLDRKDLVRVGMTAFLHEVGAISISHEILESTRTAACVKQQELSKLPLLSASFLAELGGGRGENLARIVSAYENRGHIPAARIYHAQMISDAIAEVIAVADAYDHLTSPRLGNTALPLDQALEVLVANREKKFSRWAVKLLVDVMGRYPIGTLLELETGEQGIVWAVPPGSGASRPKVRLIMDRDGVLIHEPTVVDLNATDATGQPLHTILRTLDANKEGVNIAHFFLD